MTQKDKQLLFQDLCARLPYGVKVQHQRPDYLAEIQTIEHISRQYGEIETESVVGFVDDFKPYLRPMSSMSEEEFVEFRNTWEVLEHRPDVTALSTESYDWLNANHFDYRKLIEKGLAIEAPEDMYKEKQQ